MHDSDNPVLLWIDPGVVMIDPVWFMTLMIFQNTIIHDSDDPVLYRIYISVVMTDHYSRSTLRIIQYGYICQPGLTIHKHPDNPLRL